MKMHKVAISLFVVVSWCICQNSATLLVFDGDQLVGNYSAGLIVFQGTSGIFGISFRKCLITS